MLKSVTLAAVAALSLRAPQARADEACSKAYDGALALSDAPERDPAGLYAASKTCLEACAKSAADQSTLTECESWKTKSRDFLAFATFDIRDDAGALVTEGTVSIDGATPRAITRDPIELNPGTHTFKIDVRLPSGTVSSTTNESFNSKESRTVKVALKPQSPAGEVPVAPAPPLDQGGGTPVWPFVVGGIGAAAMIAGAVLVGVGASVNTDPFQAPVCDNQSESYDWQACHDLQADPPSGVGPIAGGAVLLVLGTGGVIAGIVGLATAPKRKPASALVFVPVVGPGFAAGLLRGSF